MIAVGSHDTASAVVAVPAQGRDFAYISCGTWSLVGVELDQPVLTEASRTANFTNETGVDGTIRYLRNVMGLWLLQESVRTWSGAGQPADLAALLEEAARVPPLQVVVDPDDPVFLPPGDMPARIAGAARRTGQRPPADPPAVVRCILDSLALAYRARLREVQELSGRAVGTVHVVGGGVRNALLLPAHRGRLRPARGGRPGRGGRAGQHPGPGEDAGRGARRPGRDARAAARDPAAAPLRAVRRCRGLGRRRPPDRPLAARPVPGRGALSAQPPMRRARWSTPISP